MTFRRRFPSLDSDYQLSSHRIAPAILCLMTELAALADPHPAIDYFPVGCLSFAVDPKS